MKRAAVLLNFEGHSTVAAAVCSDCVRPTLFILGPRSLFSFAPWKPFFSFQ